MAKGRSLHVGINQNDPAHYPGLKKLLGAERDALAMAKIAEAQRFTGTALIGPQATVAAVRAEIAAAAKALAAGDTFLFSYAGHGSQMPDHNDDEPDGVDETLCLYDKQLVDDLLYTDFGLFAKGVRIVMVSDSCHSGTVARDFLVAMRAAPSLHAWIGDDAASRAMPPELASSVYLAHAEEYAAMQKTAAKDAQASVKASVLLLGACQDIQEAKDGAFNGRFTRALLQVWNGGKYLDSTAPTYRDFLKRITTTMADPSQVPNLFQAGADDLAFPKIAPFRIGAA